MSAKKRMKKARSIRQNDNIVSTQRWKGNHMQCRQIDEQALSAERGVCTKCVAHVANG